MPSRAPWVLHRRFLRGCGMLLAVAAAVAAGGCGFHPVGSAGGELPPEMHATYVASGEPYGNLENRLRRAIVARGAQVARSRAQASAVLSIAWTQFDRRVLAVNTHGQPIEYGLEYRVRFSLAGADGKALLVPQDIALQRYMAYNTTIELGSTRRQTQLVADMQNEAVQLIMLRLEALAKRDKAAKPAQ